MEHLSRDELLALAESEAPVAARHHAAECRRCRAEVESLRRVLRETRSLDVPEPSPLFWDHFSARVRGAIERERAPARAGAWPWLAPRWIAVSGTLAATVLAGVLAVGRVPAGPAAGTPVPAVAGAPAPDQAGAPRAWSAEPEGEAWELVAGLAESVEDEGLAELLEAAPPGAAEQMVPLLTAEEQVELERIIRSEMEKGRPS